MAAVRDSRGRFVAGSGSGVVSINASVTTEFRKLQRKVEQYNIESLTHAAGLVRKTAQRSIRRRKGTNYSKPGNPPKTGTGDLRKAIVYHVDRQSEEAVIGPTANVIDGLGALHEFGGRNRRGRYEPRPFMGPAHDTILPRLPESWRRKIRPGSG